MPRLKPEEAGAVGAKGPRREALQLILGLRRHLGACAEQLLGVWALDARGAPGKYREHVILEVAEALRTRPASAKCWKELAEILLAGAS